MRLIVFSGLPAVGKTTLSRKLVGEITAVYLRIDTIEQAILKSKSDINEMADAGYQAAYELAADNLTAGNSVIADAVNPINLVREHWAKIALLHNAELTMIEIICSDASEHKDRAENRKPDISDHKLPTWQQILERKYEAWNIKRAVIDTAGKSISYSYNEIAQLI